ncbi:Retrovirus-related Pol polyprotein from transposon, partial [Dictyocoela muelleri]
LIKKSDNTLRFVYDARALNKVTEAEVMSMPRVDEILASLNGSRYFSVLDNLKGFNQILIEEEDRHKTSFIGPDNLKYQHIRMPYGLIGAPTTFTKTLSLLFSEVLGKFCHIYMDDLILYTSNFEDHLKYLEHVLKIYKDSGLKLSLKKCKFAQESVKYLGHIISKKGIQIDPVKLQGIRDYETPRNVKEVRRFLGMSSYYRKFINGFSSICAPLTNLTKKYSKFIWSELEEKAFVKLKELLSSSPILIHPNFNNPFKLHTDVLDLAIGAVLTQESNGVDKPIAYFSRKLTPQESRYSVTEREALAIVKSVRHFDYYLYEHKFTIISDHQP